MPHGVSGTAASVLFGGGGHRFLPRQLAGQHQGSISKDPAAKMRKPYPNRIRLSLVSSARASPQSALPGRPAEGRKGVLGSPRIGMSLCFPHQILDEVLVVVKSVANDSVTALLCHNPFGRCERLGKLTAMRPRAVPDGRPWSCCQRGLAGE